MIRVAFVLLRLPFAVAIGYVLSPYIFDIFYQGSGSPTSELLAEVDAYREFSRPFAIAIGTTLYFLLSTFFFGQRHPLNFEFFEPDIKEVSFFTTLFMLLVDILVRFLIFPILLLQVILLVWFCYHLFTVSGHPIPDLMRMPEQPLPHQQALLYTAVAASCGLVIWQFLFYFITRK